MRRTSYPYKQHPSNDYILRPLRGNDVPLWVDGDGIEHRLDQMDTSHIANAMNLCKRIADSSQGSIVKRLANKEWYEIFDEEIKRRTLGSKESTFIVQANQSDIDRGFFVEVYLDSKYLGKAFLPPIGELQ